MKLKSIMQAATVAGVLAYAGTAVAAVQTVDGTVGAGDQYVITSSTAALTFSNDVITAFSLGGVSVSAEAPSTYTAPTVSSNISTFSYDDATSALNALTLAGGATQTAVAGPTGGPGSLTLKNVTLDVNSKQIFADVTGANGVVAGNYAFFNVAAVTGATSFTGAGSFTAGATGLALTADGLSLISKGLKLNGFGTNVLASIKDFGSLSATVTVGEVPAVPEPSTYALFSIGLAAAALCASRRRSSTH